MNGRSKNESPDRAPTLRVTTALVDAGLTFQYSPYQQTARYGSVWFVPFEDGRELRIWFDDESHLILGSALEVRSSGESYQREDGIWIFDDPPLACKRLALGRLDRIHDEIYGLIEALDEIEGATVDEVNNATRKKPARKRPRKTAGKKAARERPSKATRKSQTGKRPRKTGT
jgi:hypothetical protein